MASSVHTVLKQQDPGVTIGVFVALLTVMVVLAVVVYKPRSLPGQRSVLPCCRDAPRKPPRDSDNSL
ncbi:hypothetical protein V1264_021913 [Littorina saxatilis]|uniref:Uncharacterized protein n=1 Tax=Littorina saxatilis TaxID=31220 RepID=A0AAN9AJH4_9CAEN